MALAGRAPTAPQAGSANDFRRLRSDRARPLPGFHEEPVPDALRPKPDAGPRYRSCVSRSPSVPHFRPLKLLPPVPTGRAWGRAMCSPSRGLWRLGDHGALRGSATPEFVYCRAPPVPLRTDLPDAYHRTESREATRTVRRDVGAQSRRGGARVPRELPGPLNGLGSGNPAGGSLVMGARAWLPLGSPIHRSRCGSDVWKEVVLRIAKAPLCPASAPRLHRSTAASPGDGPARLRAVP